MENLSIENLKLDSRPVTPIIVEDNNSVVDQFGWEINNLGIPAVPSPLPCTAFIPDTDRILMNPRTSTIGGRSSTPSLDKLSSDATKPIFVIPSLLSVEKAGPREFIYRDPATVKAAIVTCGGVCPGLNNVIRSIVNCLWYRYGVCQIIGLKHGYEGLNPKTSEIMKLEPKVVRDIHQFGGSILGTSRGPQDVTVMVDYLVSLDVNVLFAVGGDGTQKGAKSIWHEIEKRDLKISVVGVPKTVDNDISYVERTFGFETAVELAQPAIKAAHEEARSAKNGIGIVKLMGRESGFIALHAALASGDVNLLLLPEMKFTMEGVVDYVVERFKYRRHCVIVVSEGAGQELCAPAQGLGKDASGNAKFADIGLYLRSELDKRLNALKIEHTIKYIDPSYIIRSAVAISSDAVFALTLGQMAVHAAMAGKTNMIVGVVNNTFVHIPIEKAVEYRKKVDIYGSTFQAWLDASGIPLHIVDCRFQDKAVMFKKSMFDDADLPTKL